MEYIINPMWFYWLQICDGLSDIIMALGLFATIGGIAIVVGVFMDDGCFLDDEAIPKWKKNSVRAIICGIICAIVSIAIPTSETLIKMQIAKFGTKDNVEVVLQTIDDKTDKLIEAIGKDK